MERLVFGISKISFETNCEDVLIENRPANFIAPVSVGTSTPLNILFQCPSLRTQAQIAMNTAAGKQDAHVSVSPAKITTSTIKTAFTQVPNAKSFNVIAEKNLIDNDDEEEGEVLASTSGSSGPSVSTKRREMPSRTSKESSLLKIRRGGITKPNKKNTIADFTALRPADIKKIYLTKSLSNFRPSNLETIFEEPQPEKSRAAGRNATASGAAGDISQLRFTGIKKLRRSLSCSDGLNVNKTLIKQRRAKIKKTFGRRFALKKIALEDFIEHLNKRMVEGEVEEDEVQLKTNAPAQQHPAVVPTIAMEEGADSGFLTFFNKAAADL